jgi:minor extracellular protease Epr
VAPRAQLYAVKSFGKNGSANLSDIIEGIVWCIQNGIRVINMSFGMNEVSETLHQVINRAYKKGIVMVASAGNGGSTSKNIDYPAVYPETIAVAASTRNNRIADFSSRGKGIDVAAPGVQILSTLPGNRYADMSGTSMAASHVTGTVALLLQLRPKLTPEQVRRILRKSAKPLSGYGVKDQGAGIIQAERAVEIVRARTLDFDAN